MFPATGAGVGAGGSGGSGSPPPPPASGSGGSGITSNQGGAGASGGGASGMGASGMGASGMGASGMGAGAGGMDGTSGMGASGMGAGAGGMDGTSGIGGASGSGAAGSGGLRTSKPGCVTKGSQGVFIGDSYVNYINNLEPLVRSRAQMAGALPSGQRYRDVAVAGTSLNYGSGQIPTQWTGIANGLDKDVKFVVMDGGGNDVLVWNSFCMNPGSATNNTCKMIVAESVATLKEMWAAMKQGGVADVVFFYYPYTPTAGGTDILDYAYPFMEGACKEQNSATFTCHFIDLRPVFEGKAYIGLDGIHPNATGAGVIADQLWMKMKDNCVGQAAASGCCMM